MVFKWPADWRDADAMSYFLSDFSSHNIRPGRKLTFWSTLICEVCQYRKTPVVSVRELQRCLAWRGMPPLCLEGVLHDMGMKGTVCKLEKLTETWTQWGVGLLTSPLSSVWTKLVKSDPAEQKYVIMSVLQDCCRRLLSEIHNTDKTLYKISEWQELVTSHVASSNINYINNYLSYSRDILTHGDPVTLVKVRRAADKCVERVTQIDIALGKADSTRDTLTKQIENLDLKITELHTAAKRAKNRTEALSHLRRKKMYEKYRFRWEGALDNTECLILQLQESVHHKIIISTLKVGADALQQNKISLTEVDNIMDKLDEYKNYEEDLNSALNMNSTACSDVELESELRDLLSDSVEIGEPATKRQTVKPIVIELSDDEGTQLVTRNISFELADNNKEIDTSTVTMATDKSDNALSARDLDELKRIEQELTACPVVPVHQEEAFASTPHPIETETIPKNIKARLSPELRRKPGRKLVGVLAPNS